MNETELRAIIDEAVEDAQRFALNRAADIWQEQFGEDQVVLFLRNLATTVNSKEEQDDRT